MVVRDAGTADFAVSVLERSHDVPVVVDFWADWCGPCKVLGPTLERLAAEAGGSWELVKVDVDQNPQLAGQFAVQGIPTVIGFRDGGPVTRFTGALPEPQIRQFLDELVPSELDLAAAHGRLLLEEGDEAGAEAAWRSVLAADPAHGEAGTGLAVLLIDRGANDEALEVLSRLAPTGEVERLKAAARVGTASGDIEALAGAAESGEPKDLLDYGKALAAVGRHGEALPQLLEAVSSRQDPVAEEARQAMVDVFEVLGEDPLVAEYRRKLANALF